MRPRIQIWKRSFSHWSPPIPRITEGKFPVCGPNRRHCVDIVVGTHRVRPLFVRPLFVRSLFVRPFCVCPLFVRPLFVRPLFVRSAFGSRDALCVPTTMDNDHHVDVVGHHRVLGDGNVAIAYGRRMMDLILCKFPDGGQMHFCMVDFSACFFWEKNKPTPRSSSAISAFAILSMPSAHTSTTPFPICSA